MNTSKTGIVSILLLLLLLSATPATGQDTRLLATKVADVLAQFPATGSAHRNRLAEEILNLGEAGIAEIARQLAPAGSGNDTAARYALNAVAAYASQFGMESNRSLVERSLIGSLAASSHVEVKSFLFSQLQIVGRESAVKAAEPYLLDPSLVEPAAQLMLSVASPAARQALAGALPKAKEGHQIVLVKALGELKAEDANSAITQLANSTNLTMRKTALAALAGIASPDSYGVITAAARKVKFQYEPANATGAVLAYARNLGEKGDLANCEKVCRLILKNCNDAGRLAVNSAALGILVDYRGYEALPDLLRAVDNKDKAYRNAVLHHAEKITGVAAMRQWIAKAQRAVPAVKAEIIGLIGRQGDARALPFLRSSLAASESEVCLAAAEALARIRKADAAEDLLPLLKTRSDEDARRIAGILQWTLDERHLEPLAAMLDGLSPGAKAGAIEVIGAKAGKRYFDKIFPLTADADAGVKAAAFGALKNIVGAKELPALLGLLEAANDAALIGAAQQAVVSAASQVEPAQNRTGPLLRALKISAHPERILAIAPDIGGAELLRAVIEQFEQAKPDLQTAAFRALVRWRDPEAAQRLYQIAASGDAKFRDEAFNGFVRQISASSLPAEQKLLQFRKILTLARRAAERRSVIRVLDRVKNFQSFMVAASFLDDPEVGSDAAAAAMRIALPSSGARDGLSGTVVCDILNKVIQGLRGAESEYDKENIRSYLAALPADPGYVSLFNGRDLAGWKGLVENPIARAKMTPQELAAKQAEADKKAQSNWSVRDGTIVFNGSGDNLCTIKDYGDFEMLVDWRITKDGDSGIYLRGTPQVQIWDPARVDVGAQVGSGGLYNNQKNPSRPLVKADNPVGEWNTLRIIMIGDKVTVFLNGIKVVDQVMMENYWDRKQPIFPTGAIELQAHGTDLAFRDLWVREISDREYRLTGEERAEGFVALFNGRDLAGWIGNLTGYKVEEGVLAFHPELGTRGNLYTAGAYGDFQFRFEFQLTPAANSGVGIRAPLEGDAAYVGMEIQVLDDPAPVYAALQPYQYHGSVYGVIPAKRGFLKPTGEWNSEEIMIRGTRIRVTLNGMVIVDGDIAEASKNGTLDHQKHPGLERTSGYIGWLSHDSVVRFRNIRIKDLSPAK